MSEENETKVPDFLQEIADAGGGKVDFVSGPLPDGSGYATISFPLPEKHWIYTGPAFNVPPMPFRMGVADQCSILMQRHESIRPFNCDPPIRVTRERLKDMICDAGKYAIRCATMNGKEMDFDPDALLQNLVVGMLGYWTDNGLSGDDWANPPQPTGPAPTKGEK